MASRDLSRWRRVRPAGHHLEDRASWARLSDEADAREQAVRDLDWLGHELVALGETALARAEELRRP